MDNKQRIHKRRENETPEQRELRLSHDCLNKKRKRELETDEQREIRLAKDRESKRRKRSILMPIDEHQNRQEEIESNIQQLTESDRILLQDFRSEMNKLGHKSCPVCNERFLSIDIVKGMCRRCYKDNKNNMKKFSSRNNMDPGDEDPPFLPIAVFVEFDNYTGPAITSAEGIKVVLIPPIRRSWKTNTGPCSRLQIPISLSWAITVHKSQELTLTKAVIDIGKKEYASGLSFVAVSRVCALENILFKPFSFERLQRIKNSKRMQEQKVEEIHLISMIVR